MFTLKADLIRGTVLYACGFDGDVRSEGRTRIDIRSVFEHREYRFYIYGRCYTWNRRDQLEDWVRRFDPPMIDSWAREVDGDFAILVFDAKKHEAYLLSDRNGPTRTYYSYQGDCLYVSNSRYELIRALGSAKISSPGAYQLLTLGYVVDPESLLENVRVTMPGQVIHFASNGKLDVRRYFSPVALESDYFRTEAECVTALDAAYRQVVTKRLATIRIPCVMLSGGIDSLTLMKYLKEAYAGKLMSLTYSFKGLYPNELEPARMASRHFGTEHHEIVIDPEDAGRLFIQNLQTDAADGTYLTSFGIQSYLQRLGGFFDLFTGQDTRLHTPPFDNPRQLGILLNRAPESSPILRSIASFVSRLLPHWPVEGSFKHYLQYWARNLEPRDDLRSYVLEGLTPFKRPSHDRVGQAQFYRYLLQELPNFRPEDSLQLIFKKYVSFEYRAQYTDDMNCLASSLTGPVSDVHCPFYDWQAVEASNRVPYRLGMRGDITFKTWNKMPYVRKRIARLLVQDAVPDTLLYRAKKTCPHLDLIFNSSMSHTAQSIFNAWLPDLLEALEPEARDVVQANVQEFSSKLRFDLYDDLLLRKIQSICYLAVLHRVCENPAIRLDRELESIANSGGVKHPEFAAR